MRVVYQSKDYNPSQVVKRYLRYQIGSVGLYHVHEVNKNHATIRTYETGAKEFSDDQRNEAYKNRGQAFGAIEL